MNSAAVELTRELVRVDTIQGREAAAAAIVAPRLEAAGFDVVATPHAPGRDNLLATWSGGGGEPPLTLTGHLDTVPLGAGTWSFAPHGGDIGDGFVHGRGASDMKGGIAAIVTAAEQIARGPARRGALRIILTAAEETGCRGATPVVRTHTLTPSGPIIVAEPTGNQIMLGHKGTLWLTIGTSGVAAHGSAPDRGENAIYKLARAVTKLAGHRIAPVTGSPFGSPTLNTDAAVLWPASGKPPLVICGPGDPDQAHATDECCPIDAIDVAADRYRRAFDEWCHTTTTKRSVLT